MISANAWSSSQNDEERREARRARSRQLVRRSMLFVPANVPRFVEKAHERGADAIILDLEDSVLQAEKESARPSARAAIPIVARGGADVLVRINKPFEQAVLDLDAMIVEGLAGVSFPKAETAKEIAILNALIAERELRGGLRPGSVGILVAIESARGIFNLPEIVAECDRVERVFGISYGAEDATEELGVETTAEGSERFYGNAVTLQAAVAAGVQPYGRLGSAFDFQDLQATEDSMRRSALFGFKGASCIHPAQVAPMNRAFAPTREQVSRARKTIEVMQQALAAGRASASLDGCMVDTPTLRRAERVLERAAAIEAKDARKKR